MSLANRFAVPHLDGPPPKSSLEIARSASDLSMSITHGSDQDFAMKPAAFPMEMPYHNTSLTPREALELFENAVDNARQGIQSLAGSAKATEVAKPKLTLDLKHCKLDRIPGEVVEIIRQDVERLQLAHNQLRDIPYDFISCAPLKYLNLRDNRFIEIPRAVFGLPQLEILDLSRNYLQVIPEEIEKMRALRVFSIQHNSIQDLPLGLGSINTLRMLKLTGNPLNPKLKKLLENHEEIMSPSTPVLPSDENEKDKILTRKITEYLRTQATLKESGEDSSDGPLETPRAQSRFPIQPLKYGHSTSGSESASDQRSPNYIKPAIPSRSHFCGPSAQNVTLQTSASALRRPGLAPLSLGNERNRSNSESILQATQNNKNKRMGIVPKKQLEPGMFDEQRINRSSLHSRGQSHGSALRNGVRASDGSDTEVNSPKPRGDGTFVRRLSSVPEQKQGAALTDEIAEGAKGILYSLHLVHPQIQTIMSLFKDSKAKRHSLQRLYHEASTHLDNLDQQIHRFDHMQHRSIRLEQEMRRIICRASQACVLAYKQIGAILVSNVSQLNRESDMRYVRTLVLMLYGGLNEAQNAQVKSAVDVEDEPILSASIHTNSRLRQIARDEFIGNRISSTTPTQEHPKPGRRWENENVHHSSYTRDATTSTGSRVSATTLTTGRSRSSSRAGGMYSSASSSVASTPYASDSFSENVLAPRSRSGSIAPSNERAYEAQAEHDHFERLFLTLNKAADQGLQVIPHLEPRFVSQLEMSKKTYVPPHIKELLIALVSQSRVCMETSETLQSRLSTITIFDSDIRNTPDFWPLAKRFVNAYGNFFVSLREARVHQIVDNDLRHTLRPIHKSTTDAAKLMSESPLNRLTSTSDEKTGETLSQPPSALHSRAPTPNLPIGHPPTLHIPLPQPPPPTPVMMQPPSRSQSRSQSRNEAGYHRRAGGAKGSNGSNNGVVSPASYNSPIPATPLSAALGPAAQAMISTTPSSMAGLNKSFEGDVFQRAEYLQNTMRRLH